MKSGGARWFAVPLVAAAVGFTGPWSYGWLVDPIFAGAALGALGGIGAGGVLARARYRAQPGHAFVVRRGRRALPLTPGAALVPSLIVGLGSAAVIAALGFSRLGTGLLVGAVVVTLVGCVIGAGSALVRQVESMRANNRWGSVSGVGSRRGRGSRCAPAALIGRRRVARQPDR